MFICLTPGLNGCSGWMSCARSLYCPCLSDTRSPMARRRTGCSPTLPPSSHRRRDFLCIERFPDWPYLVTFGVADLKQIWSSFLFMLNFAWPTLPFFLVEPRGRGMVLSPAASHIRGAAHAAEDRLSRDSSSVCRLPAGTRSDSTCPTGQGSIYSAALRRAPPPFAVHWRAVCLCPAESSVGIHANGSILACRICDLPHPERLAVGQFCSYLRIFSRACCLFPSAVAQYCVPAPFSTTRSRT